LAPEVVQAFADALVHVDFKYVLILLGQRLTSASLTDARAIPPTRAQLLAAATRPHSAGDPLTVVARALAKHARRSPEAFWGVARGPVSERNAAALRLLEDILDHTTWWNVFGHFQHDLVYEVRIPSGHGARWGHDGTEFIGFLEPFDESKRRQAVQPDPGGAVSGWEA
jgi:hypothetical protein